MASTTTTSSEGFGFFQTEFNMKDAFRSDRMQVQVRQHLKKVYATLSIGVLTCITGAFLAYRDLLPAILGFDLLNLLAMLGLVIAIGVTEHNNQNVAQRMGMFGALAFLMGVSMDTLISFVSHTIDPQLPLIALVYTSMIFISFSLVALFSPDRREYLYLGGFLFSALNWMIFASFFNMFFGSIIINNFLLYGGLILFAFYIMFDTQFIIAKREFGDEDFISHALTLFLDAVNIFRRVLVILASNSEDRRRRR